jgi:hypothetical protein
VPKERGKRERERPITCSIFSHLNRSIHTIEGKQTNEEITEIKSQESVITTELQEKNDKKQRARLNASVKNSPAKTSKAIKAELIETTGVEATPSTSRSVRLKSLNIEKESNLNQKYKKFN